MPHLQATSNRFAVTYWPEEAKLLQPPWAMLLDNLPVPGRYNPGDNILQMDRGYLDLEGVDETLAVLIHELGHWAVNAHGIVEYHHHGPVWKRMLRQAGFDPDILRYALEMEDAETLTAG